MQKVLNLLVLTLITIQSAYSGNLDVLQNAGILEHLEANFYAKGVQMFSDADFQRAGLSGAYSQFQLLAKEEATHVAFIDGAIKSSNATPAGASCNYSFNFQTVPQFVALARVLETVGVSAYIGSFGQVTDPAFAITAATIATIEARHQAYLNIVSNASGFPQPYDTPLDINFILTLAAPFISCPFALPQASPALSITPSSGISGSKIYIKNLNNTKNLYCSFLYGQQQSWSKIVTSGKNIYCIAPQVPASLIYVFVTSDNKTQIQTGSAPSVKYGPAIFAINAATNTGASNSGTTNNGASNTGATNNGASNSWNSNPYPYTYTVPNNNANTGYVAPIPYGTHALRKQQNNN